MTVDCPWNRSGSGGARRYLGLCNRVIIIYSALALIAACVILGFSVLTRALFNTATYWQAEAAVFLLVGATFVTAAYVQS